MACVAIITLEIAAGTKQREHLLMTEKLNSTVCECSGLLSMRQRICDVRFSSHSQCFKVPLFFKGWND